MTKKALIVGVSDYAPLAQNLESSLFEALQWQDLLVRTYGFAENGIRVLRNGRATKAAILERLTWLFGQASPADQLVFVYCGHGIRGQRMDSAGHTIDHEDEALLPFPEGARDQRDVAIFDDELTELYGSMALPRGALPTLILNCCYSAGIDFCERPDLRKSIPTFRGSGFTGRAIINVVRFGLGIASGATSAPPVILAATHDTDVAIEVEAQDRTRSLFSLRTLEALRANPALTYSQLVDTISSQMQYASQTPCLRGDPQRIHKPFFQ